MHKETIILNPQTRFQSTPTETEKAHRKITSETNSG